MIKDKEHNGKITIGYMTIPNEIVFNNNIKQLSKFLLGLILSFQYYNQCFSSNEWFAKQFDVSIRTIETCIKELKDKKYIDTIYSNKYNKRLIIVGDYKIWQAYSKIRNSNTILDIVLKKQNKEKLKKEDYDLLFNGFKKITA